MEALPPLGKIGPDDHSTVVGYLSDLAKQAKDASEAYIELANENRQVYVYGDDPAPADDQLIVNEIRTAIISSTDVQVKDPPQVLLEPVETGEPGEVYWIGPAQIPQQVATGQVDPATMQPISATVMGAPFGLPPEAIGSTMGPNTQPIPEDQAEDIKRQLVTQPQRRWLAEVNDRTLADLYQQVYDVYAQRSRFNRRLRRNVFSTNIDGWALWLYEFDDAQKRHVLTSLSLKQAYLDATAEEVRDMAYVGVDLVLDVDRAKAIYPHLADAIEENAKTGVPQQIDQNTEYGEAVNDVDFKNRVIPLRIFWLRHQPMPWSPANAAAMGMVTEGMASDPVTGEPVGTGIYTLPGSDVPVTPDSPEWPQRRGIRQITVIAGSVVDDRECEHADIPVLLNQDIPVPDKPFGLGEPYGLRRMQQARSRVLNAMVRHTEFFQHPLSAMPQSMYDAVRKEYGEARLEPGRTLIVPDDLWMAMGGKIDTTYDPPPLSEAQVQVAGILKNEIIEQSGHAEVLQGRAQANVKSGRAIQLLQEAAASMIGFKSQSTGYMLEDLAELALHSLVWRLDAQDIMQIVSRYPLWVVEKFVLRARAIEWNVSVTVASGNGAVQARKKQEAAADLQLGAISRETYQEAGHIDHRREQARMQEEQMEAAAQPMLAAATTDAIGRTAPQPPTQPQQVTMPPMSMT